MDKVQTLLYTVYFIYFFCGLTQSFESVFLPEFKEHFNLTYQQQMYTMFAKNIPFLLAAPIGYAIRYTGYKRCMALAMALFALGTWLLIPGLRASNYSLLLAGFFLIGLGFNCELVAGNPMLSGLGPRDGASSRLNLGNALGAVAQIVAPAAVTLILPAAAVSVSAKLPYIEGLFLALGAVLAAVALLTARARDVDIDRAFDAASPPGSIWRQGRVLFGFLTICICLGVEAGQFGFFRNFLEDPAVAGLASRRSQQMFTVYFAVFAAGRMAASGVQRRIAPARHIVLNMGVAIVCLTIAMTAKGTVAVAAMILLGFFTSILFPTLYALAIENMGPLTGRVSGLLTMGFIGCAIIPVLQGRIADSSGIQKSYWIGFAAYGLAILYAWTKKGARHEP